jgi:hypothetical protein
MNPMRVAGLAVLAACSVPPFAGHDEDGDGVADIADPCPHLANADQDTDGDGIGDACDPYPHTPGDHMFFYSFATGTDDLVLDSGGVAALDALELGSVGNATESAFVQHSFTSVRVEIGFEIVTVGTAAMFRELGIRTMRSDINTNDDACLVGQALADSTSHLEAQEPPVFAPVPLPVTLDQVSGHMLVTQIDGVYRCAIDGVAGVPATSTSLNPTFTFGRAGISADGIIVRLHYLFVAGR